jgi:hypothetical protein
LRFMELHQRFMYACNEGLFEHRRKQYAVLAPGLARFVSWEVCGTPTPPRSQYPTNMPSTSSSSRCWPWPSRQAFTS